MTGLGRHCTPPCEPNPPRWRMPHSAYSLFLQESFRSIRTTASVIPSSRFLAMAMLENVDFRNARTFVELGSGTGVITREILRRMSPDSRLFVVEINDNFVDHLRSAYPDRRLTVLHGDARHLMDHLRAQAAGSAHAVISSLGLTTMTHDHRARIVAEARACIAPAGVMTQYQYLTPIDPLAGLPRLQLPRFLAGEFLTAYFPSVSAKRVLLNLPPALVFTCRK